MNSVSMVTKRSARIRPQKAARASLSVIRVMARGVISGAGASLDTAGALVPFARRPGPRRPRGRWSATEIEHASLSYAPLRRSAPGATSAARRASAAGYTGSATTASYSSSTCATMPASTQLVFQPGTAPFARGRGAAPGERGHRHRQGGRAHARDREPGAADRRGRAGRGRRWSVEFGGRHRCRSRSTASATIPRRRGSSTASSTCAARRCSATSCCARRSSPASAGG